MAGKNTAVFGIYSSGEHVERAVDSIIAADFANSDISVLLPDTRSTKEFAHHKDTKAPEGTTAGVTAGGVIGGTIGVLAGVGALAIPGVGPFIAAGPIMAGLAGLGVGGVVGGTLLSVHCDSSGQISRAKDLLKSTGAEDIASSSESSSDNKAARVA